MEVAVSRKFFAFTPSMPLVLGWIRFLVDSNSSSLTYWSHIFMKNDKINQFLILRNRHSTIKAILTARFGEVEVAVGRKFNCALTVVLCREWRLIPDPVPDLPAYCKINNKHIEWMQIAEPREAKIVKNSDKPFLEGNMGLPFSPWCERKWSRSRKSGGE